MAATSVSTLVKIVAVSALIAAESGLGAIGFIGAIVMTVLLRRVSGVVMLEKTIGKRRAGYDEYIKCTSPFIPRPPRSA